MNTRSLALGIDIGWSELQQTCAFAAIDLQRKIAWPDRSARYNSEDIGCCRFRLSELLEFLRSLDEVMNAYEEVVVVLDGPLGPHGQPKCNRSVDSFFRRGQFKNRMQPSDVENKDGRTYVEATYRVAQAISADFSLWMGGERGKLLVTETNPTVGLALMNKKFTSTDLPSRKYPLLPPNNAENENAIRTKSDFYWQAGGNQICSDFLKHPQTAKERHHENIAGLYCLTVATAIISGRELVVGSADDGVYVFPNCIHSDWHSDLESAKLLSGKFSAMPPLIRPYDFTQWKRRATPQQCEQRDLAIPEEYESDLQEACKGDSTILLLNDNGGVHQKHNPWLTDLDTPVTIRLVEKNLTATLERANGSSYSKHWKINSKNKRRKANGIAQLYGLDVRHLSNESHIAIEIEILAVGK